MKLRELSDAGFSDPRFYVSGWANGTTLEIALSYETEEARSNTTDQLTAILADMDSSYFFLKGKNIEYVVADHPIS